LAADLASFPALARLPKVCTSEPWANQEQRSPVTVVGIRYGKGRKKVNINDLAQKFMILANLSPKTPINSLLMTFRFRFLFPLYQ
jgi:hypothetical protein